MVMTPDNVKNLEGHGMKIRVTAPLAAASAAVLAFGLAACSGSAATPSGATASSATIPLLRVGRDQDITSLDETKNIYADQVSGLSLDTLLTYNQQGKLEPYLASSWAQTSPVTYVYHLRHGATFWDGHPVTATDVAYSLNYDRRPGSEVAFAFIHVKSIVATGPDTVTVVLTQPEASWKYVPAEETSFIFEKQFQEAHASTFGLPGTLVMGSGPWIIKSLDPTKGATLVANPHWWGGKVMIQRITFSFFATETSEALAFRAGEIDADPDISSPKSFASTSGATILSAESCGNGFFSMNTSQPGWDDVHVRRAVAYALNRTDIIAAAGGYATPIYTFTPPQLLDAVASPSQVNGLLASLPLYQYNLAKARQEMAESAYPHGFSATLDTSNDQISIDENEVIAAELAKIGIQLKVKAVDTNTLASMDTGPAAQRPTGMGGGGCFQPDPNTYSDFLGSDNLQVGSWNVADYAPAEVDQLLAQGEASSNSAQRFAVYSKLFQKLQADEPYVGLFVTDSTGAISSKFTWTDYSPWWWDEAYTLGIRPAAQ
jgi:peptide/nickel transport system substrate-binding protein